jgi:hypothetical protein
MQTAGDSQLDPARAGVWHLRKQLGEISECAAVRALLGWAGVWGWWRI